MIFSEKIKILRKNAGLTQQELSKHLGITASAVGFLENGKHDPNGSTLIAYAKFFDLSIDSLVGLEPDIEDTYSVVNEKRPSLSKDELELIEEYRTLAPYLQEMLKATIRTWKDVPQNASAKKRL